MDRGPIELRERQGIRGAVFLLLPKFKETAARFNERPNLAIVTSETHFMVDFKGKGAPEGIFNFLNDKEKSDIGTCYPISKLLEVFMVREMAGRRPQDSYPVTINMVNPGLCHSELIREDNFAMQIMKFLLAHTAEEGSRTLVHGASAGPKTHGQYLNKYRAEQPGTVVIGLDSPNARRRVWDEVKAKLEKIKTGIPHNL